jgi:hypothetical protein
MGGCVGVYTKSKSSELSPLEERKEYKKSSYNFRYKVGNFECPWENQTSPFGN